MNKRSRRKRNTRYVTLPFKDTLSRKTFEEVCHLVRMTEGEFVAYAIDMTVKAVLHQLKKEQDSANNESQHHSEGLSGSETISPSSEG
jgi:hypothetical protein